MAALALTNAAIPASAAPVTTVNSFTHAQDTRARKAIIEAGYQPDVPEFAQAGNLFYTATKIGDTYEVTVVPSGQVYASTGLPERRAISRCNSTSRR